MSIFDNILLSLYAHEDIGSLKRLNEMDFLNECNKKENLYQANICVKLVQLVFFFGEPCTT